VLPVLAQTLRAELGRASSKPKFRDIFSQSRAVNVLAAARVFLFGARDVWFVVALPVYLASVFGWDHARVGGFLALWIIGYGAVQALAPHVTRRRADARDAFGWAALLALVPGAIALALSADLAPQTSLLGGLLVFGALFAVNSALHSYLIVSYAREDGVSLDVGFYYMANALGRLIGTVLSGWVFQAVGLVACLWISAAFVAAAATVSAALPRHRRA